MGRRKADRSSEKKGNFLGRRKADRFSGRKKKKEDNGEIVRQMIEERCHLGG